MSDDGWVTIKRVPGGRSYGVTVSWRPVGGRKSSALAVSMGAELCQEMGLQRPEKGLGRHENNRVIVQHNPLRGKLRIFRATTEPSIDTRAPAWKDGGATVAVPLQHLESLGRKPAQEVKWSFANGVLEVSLPPWACPPVRIETGRAA